MLNPFQCCCSSSPVWSYPHTPNSSMSAFKYRQKHVVWPWNYVTRYPIAVSQLQVTLYLQKLGVHYSEWEMDGILWWLRKHNVFIQKKVQSGQNLCQPVHYKMGNGCIYKWSTTLRKRSTMTWGGGGLWLLQLRCEKCKKKTPTHPVTIPPPKLATLWETLPR